MLILDRLSAATDGVAGGAALALMARLLLPFVKYTVLTVNTRCPITLAFFEL